MNLTNGRINGFTYFSAGVISLIAGAAVVVLLMRFSLTAGLILGALLVVACHFTASIYRLHAFGGDRWCLYAYIIAIYGLWRIQEIVAVVIAVTLWNSILTFLSGR